MFLLADIQQFLNVLNARDSDYEYRLPTETEWEYSCRAGLAAAYDAAELGQFAWYKDNSSERKPVKRKSPNPWGVYDMLGNVWEWTLEDSDLDNIGGNVSGGAGHTGKLVAKGGAFATVGNLVTCSDRGPYSAKSYFIGFRVVAYPLSR